MRLSPANIRVAAISASFAFAFVASIAAAEPSSNHIAVFDGGGFWGLFLDWLKQWLEQWKRPNGPATPSPAATPELGSLVLFGSGLIGAGGYALTRLRARKQSE